MYYVEIFDHDQYKRFVGGGDSVKSAKTLAERDADRYYPGENLNFAKDIGDDPLFLWTAHMTNGLRYRIHTSQEQLDRVV